MRKFLPAAFYRGGTSKAVIFKKEDLPCDENSWSDIFLHVMGSPDAYGRQLDGMGGGLSSLSKVVVVGHSEQPEVDLDYSFFQVSVDQAVVDAGAMCGNMASAVGPFAIESGMVKNTMSGNVQLTVRNTNTNKIFEAQFEVSDGEVVEKGDFSIPGVSGSGAAIALRFLDPAGSRTAAFLPTGNASDHLQLPSGERILASLVDATNPVVFILAEDLGLQGSETVEALESNGQLMGQLEQIRRAGSVAMKLSDTMQTASLANPKVALVAAPQSFQASNGEPVDADEMDVTIRIISMGRVHRAVTLTGGMCLAAALNIPGFVLQYPKTLQNPLRIAHPSGVFPVSVQGDFEQLPTVKSLTCFRTQRCLMKGSVPVPEHLLNGG